MDLPERFKIDEDDDVDDGTGVGNEDNPVFAHQSVYGMIAATQSRINFASLFQQDSGSEGEGDDDDGTRKRTADGKASVHKHKQSTSGEAARKDKLGSKKHPRKWNENKLAPTFLKPIKEKDGSQYDDPMTQSQLLPPRDEQPQEMEQPTSIRTDAPILDRKLQAMAKAEMESSNSLSQKSRDEETSEEVVQQKASKSLPKVIANIFQFREPEDVVSEYPCWYTQNVLLQGFMYITQKHVCFYCYLHKKTNTILKQGHLGKQGKHGYLYHRYWFVLKGDNFSYYKSSSEPYFPLGVVDLRYAISAEVSTPAKGKDAADFTITTPDRVYYYRADNSLSARDWVKQLQKVIFRSHNEGDSVKLSLPLENILDVEETNVFDFAETVKLRVLAGDNTFAIDEYFFTFFSCGKEAMNLLNVMTEGNAAKRAMNADETMSPLRNLRIASDNHSPSQRSSREHGQGPVRSTLSPLSLGGVASGDALSRKDRSKSPESPSMKESTESFVSSSEHAASTSTIDDAIDPHMSASQMLTDDGIFQRPTLRMSQHRRTGSGSTLERPRDKSQDNSRGPSAERVRVQPPTTWQPTDQDISDDRLQLQRHGTGGSGRTLEADDHKKLHPLDIKGPGRLVRGMSMPLQHAMTVADMVRSSGKRMGSYLSSSPKTYLSNFSEAFVGGKRHYTDIEGLAPDDSVRDLDQDMDTAEHERRFREHFGLPQTEKLLCVFYCWLHKTIPLYGKIYMSTSRFCFRSLLYGVGTKLVIPYKQILNAQKQRGFRWGYPGMILVIRGYEELFFDFPSYDLRDDAVVTVYRNLDTGWEAAAESTLLTAEELQDAADAAAENESLQEARKDGHADHDLQLLQNLYHTDPGVPPILFDDPAKSKLEIKPRKSLRIVCVTIGSRGDVQPFIALCKGLIAEGHRPKLATHAEFKPWIEKHGIEFAEIAGDPAELMRICVDNGMFTPNFVIEANSKFRVWLDALCDTGWAACRDAELIIESPVAMVGIHIAEALEIPYFRAFGMPWSRTRAYPHAFAVPSNKKGGAYNYMSYTLFENVLWSWPAWQINSWRRQTLRLPPTSLGKLQINKVPFLYNFSPSVVIPPLDFSDWIKITGYWFLDEGTDYQPPRDLANFIKKARDDGQKLVYVGFGSVTVSDSKLMTQNIVDGVIKAGDVRCILSKGWSDRLTKEDPSSIPIELPSCIHQIRSAPHDWLFKQMDAAVHHGGAGTTGASLRAGIPTIIKPFFGDQWFFANRVEDLGVGMELKKMTTNELGKMIWLATHDTRLRQKAAVLGEHIRAENGVETAIYSMYSYLDYAKGLIKRRSSQKPADGEVDDTEENWTFIEKENLDFRPVPDDDEDEDDENNEDEADEDDGNDEEDTAAVGVQK